jgi:SAM-dependent methyltransferase
MDYRQIYYPESKIGGFTDVDGTVAFYIRVNSLVTPASVLLDLGCGRGAYGEDPISIRRQLRIFKNRVARVIGVDLDRRSAENPFVDELHLMYGDTIPLDSDSVDLCICDHVLEHVNDVERFFAEIRRVLRNGGYLCIRTPNSMGYVSLAARIIPKRFHFLTLSKAQHNRQELDIFPTYYKCNTVKKILFQFGNYGFTDCVVYGHESDPQYLSLSRIFYFLGYVYQRFAPKQLRSVLFAFARLEKS